MCIRYIFLGKVESEKNVEIYIHTLRKIRRKVDCVVALSFFFFVKFIQQRKL